MKKIAKALVLIILLFAVGIFSFTLGSHSQLALSLNAKDGQKLNDDQTIVENIKHFRKIFKDQYYFDYQDKNLETGIYKGLFAGLDDPYSAYFTGEEFVELMESTEGEFIGVGVVVSAGEDNLITVVSPIEGSPGAKAGLQTGDKILAVDGTVYYGENLEEASRQMRGEENTEVVLTVRKADSKDNKTEEITIKRAKITVESVYGQILDDKIAYVRMTSFDEHTDEDMIQMVDEYIKKGAKGLVLDLRNNPGGLLTSCQAIADYFLAEGDIVITEDKNKKQEKLTSDKEKVDIPMAVLVNGGSASASEILVGALRDHKRAVSIGTKTFGKGIIQQVYPLGIDPKDGGFKLTVAEYLTPNGEKIHGKGIEPDIVLELDEEAKGIGPDHFKEDNQLQKALEEVKKKIK